jgi:hypothetical protein
MPYSEPEREVSDMLICDVCIKAIRSRGEDIFVGQRVDKEDGAV